jgi:hypothetical protein
MLFAFEELPVQAQEDFLLLIEENKDLCPDECVFSLKKIPYEQLLEEFDLMIGPNLIDEVEGEYIKELAMDINCNGLINPPICSEGIHRSLAHLFLKKDMLRFELIYIFNEHFD